VHPDVTTSVTSPTGSDPIVAGYDFVGLDNVNPDPNGAPDYRAYTANDGGGRDADPSDPGDWITPAEAAGTDVTGGWFAGCADPTLGEPSSWHGTHVTGTIVAKQDNSIGISGIAPGVKVQPVRALGKCGGYSSDIDAAIEWASGGPDQAGIPHNATPATVINMSLGGPGACLASTQAAINGARSRGTTVVVAAGNSAAPVQPASSTSTSTGSQPADCAGVIAVTATTRAGTLASYSNFGTVAGNVTIAAQGGDASNSATGDITSTVNPGLQGPVDPASDPANAYKPYAGTSMATPHVAAAVALLQSRLAHTPYTPDQVKARLVATATPFPGAAGCTTVKCGAGILNIGAALPDLAGAPTSVTASAADSSAYLTWTPPASNGGSAVTGYKVMGNVGGGAFATVVADTGSTVAALHVTQFADTTPIANGLSYSFTVAAINGVGAGSASTASLPVVPDAAAPPAAPDAPAVTGGVERLDVSWVAPASPVGHAISDFAVRYRKVGAANWVCRAGTAPDCNVGSTATSTSVAPWPSGSLAGGTYEAQVAAVNDIGRSVWSPSGTAVVTALTQTVTVSATTLRPFRDGFQDSVALRVATNRPGKATGSLRILNAKLVVVKIVPLALNSAWLVTWKGLNARNLRVPNGRYYVQVYLQGRSASQLAVLTRPSVLVAASQSTRPAITLSSTSVYPYPDKYLDTVTIAATATVPSSFTYRITSAGRTKWTTSQTRRLKGAVVWTGRTNSRVALPAGKYVVYVTAKGGEGIAVTSYKYVVLSTKRIKAYAFTLNIPASSSHPLTLLGSFATDGSGGGSITPGTYVELAPTLPSSVKPIYRLEAYACSVSGGQSGADAGFGFLDKSAAPIGSLVSIGNDVNSCWTKPNATSSGPLYVPSASIFSGRTHILVGNLPSATGSWHLSGVRLRGTRYLLVA
jgi:subtilisin family serine protease